MATTKKKAPAKKAPAKKAAPAKKSPAKKSPAKNVTAKKVTAKKVTAKKATAVQPAPKASGTRMTAKVSPLRGMNVSEYVATKISGWQSEAATRIVALVAKTAPTSTVTIKWGQPVFDENGPFAYLKPAKAHLSFGFWRGAVLDDPKGLLEKGDRMGHVKLRGLEGLDEAAFATMITQAVKLNRELGNPAMRG